MREKGIDKVRENISKTLNGYRTTVVIRTRTEVIKGGGGVGGQKVGGSKKRERNLSEKRNRVRERNTKCGTTGI